jgi:CrcB protein
MMSGFLFVAGGGALGACLRYAVSLACAPMGPHSGAVATLIVNLAGSLALGLFAAWALVRNVSPSASMFIGVGVLGAFTTFSAFSRETVLIYLSGAVMQAAGYVLANLFGAVGAFALGFWFLRKVLA